LKNKYQKFEVAHVSIWYFMDQNAQTLKKIVNFNFLSPKKLCLAGRDLHFILMLLCSLHIA